MEMNPLSEEWVEPWRLKAIAASVSAELRLRYGLKQFYPPEEVESACGARGVEGSSKAIALAMFVDLHESQEILKAYGIFRSCRRATQDHGQQAILWGYRCFR